MWKSLIALMLSLSVLNPGFKRFLLTDEHSHKLRRVQFTAAHLAEVPFVLKRLSGKRLHIVDLTHRYDGEFTQVRSDDEWLRVGIANDSDAQMTG